MRPAAHPVVALALVVVLAAAGAWSVGLQAGQSEDLALRQFTVIARRYSFTPGRIEVLQGDLVRIALSTEDIAHSFTIDAYRIAKRASPDQPVTFEFRAERAGTFPFYCNLKSEDGCRQMHGDLVVKPRQDR
jgi:heme/copper-type cytochrome/quinol oxidase subunit 2